MPGPGREGDPAAREETGWRTGRGHLRSRPPRCSTTWRRSAIIRSRSKQSPHRPWRQKLGFLPQRAAAGHASQCRPHAIPDIQWSALVAPEVVAEERHRECDTATLWPVEQTLALQSCDQGLDPVVGQVQELQEGLD